MESRSDRETYPKLRKLAVSGLLAAVALSGCIEEESEQTTTTSTTLSEAFCTLLPDRCEEGGGQVSTTQPEKVLDLDGEDIDLDGTNNWFDVDIDDDGLLNPYDADMDGDGFVNENDALPWGRLERILMDQNHKWYVFNPNAHSDNDNIPDEVDAWPNNSMLLDSDGNGAMDAFQNWRRAKSELTYETFNDIFGANVDVVEVREQIIDILENSPTAWDIIVEDLKEDFDHDGVPNGEDSFYGNDNADYDNDGVRNYQDGTPWGF